MKRGILVVVVLVSVVAAAWAKGGYDEFGYNYQARLFNGAGDGVDRNLDGTVWGDPTYANDRLNMKWSRAWDEARFHGGQWTADAWCTNHWNGRMPPGGSGEVWHYKIKWVGDCVADESLLPEGSYCLWGQFAVIMDMGTYPGDGQRVHEWLAHGIPTGYGA